MNFSLYYTCLFNMGNRSTYVKHAINFVVVVVTLTRSASCSKSPLFQRKQITFVKDKRPVSSGIHLSKKEGKLARSLGTSLTHVSSLNC